MDERRTPVTLDDPVFAGRLRKFDKTIHGHRPEYAHKVIDRRSFGQHASGQSMANHRQSQPIHDVVRPVPASKVHAIPEVARGRSVSAQMVNSSSEEVVSIVPRARDRAYGQTRKVPEIVSTIADQQTSAPASAAITVPTSPVASQFQPTQWPQESTKKQRGFKNLMAHKPALILYGMSLVLFIFGLAVGVSGMKANQHVAAQVSQVTPQSDGSDGGGAPSTTKPTPAEVRSYAVAANVPKYVDIKKVNVHARILSMGLTKDGRLQAPGNVYDAGWYNASSQPGQNGAMLVDGHISSWQTKGVFYGLNKLSVGDTIDITRGDNQTFTYTVVKTKVFNANEVDMPSLLVSQDTAKPGLNLISCSGDVIPGTNEYDKRIVVYAVANH